MSLKAVCTGLIALVTVVGPAAAFEYSGFRMGMSEAEVLSAARRSGYQLRPTDHGYIWEASGGGSGSVSLCNGRLFAAGSTFNNATFHTFIGLVRERQSRYGEPEWKANQAYSTEGQQISTLEATWDDSVGRFQPSVLLSLYGATATKPSVTMSYSAHKYMCRR